MAMQVTSLAGAVPLADGDYLFVVSPGIRDYVEFGGAGVLVFNRNDHSFVKRIETAASKQPLAKPANIKGVCAHAGSAKLWFTTPKKLFALDLNSFETLWEKELVNGCDRMSVTPDGRFLYVPSFEKDTWNVVRGEDGSVAAEIATKSGAHNTVCGLDGKFMYLAGLRSPYLSVADTASHKVVKRVGPFSASIRPFTVNGKQTRCYVNVNELLGFEVGDIETGKKIAEVKVEGFKKGPVKRHGCPSHGIGLTPDEKEIWLTDGHNTHMHVFDITGEKARQTHSLPLREQPGWVTFSLDGKLAYPSTGEVFDVATKKKVAALKDEMGREVHSEKMIQVVYSNGKPVRTGDQFGLGRKI
ncbi:MAG: hypothetical protein EXR99_09555 [Gemmataceae bacterium]|nr:hypothetical protein [Gemmataceae bacterium]